MLFHFFDIQDNHCVPEKILLVVTVDSAFYWNPELRDTNRHLHKNLYFSGRKEKREETNSVLTANYDYHLSHK